MTEAFLGDLTFNTLGLPCLSITHLEKIDLRPESYKLTLYLASIFILELAYYPPVIGKVFAVFRIIRGDQLDA